ncbi:MAG TPA: ATP-binding protein [Polyangiaceae bacterium]
MTRARPRRSTSWQDANVRPSVLAVDDVAANLLTLDALLEGLDCDVVQANSGEAALRLLLKRQFAVMLLDVQMPLMDGYEVAAHARSNPATRDVPIIFLTAASDSEETALKAYGTGAVDFLLKPLNPTILRSKVSVFLELWRRREQLALAMTRLESKSSDLEEAYRQLKETQAQLVQTAKMASLGQLVAGVAHEINNPLSFCLSHLKTARKSLDAALEGLGELTAPVQQHWDRAQNRLVEMELGLARIADLVVKLRTFSRLDEGEFKLISVKESILALLTIVGHRLAGRIEVVTEFGEPDTLACAAGLMNQAVMNLVVNAIDAMEGQGTLTISTGADGDVYRIVVADTGTGIPAEVLERVFEPFFTTKPVGEGTGLGLSLAYSTVKKHGGTLTLENRERGTRASICIPLGPSPIAKNLL